MELTTKQIFEIHDRQIAKFGGDYGLREEGTFEMLSAAPYQSVFGVDCYPSVFDKAAKYLEGFARHQVFYDGNKRTALDSCLTYLAVNDYALNLDAYALYKYTLKISNEKEISTGEIAKYLEEHSISLNKGLDVSLENDILKKEDMLEK